MKKSNKISNIIFTVLFAVIIVSCAIVLCYDTTETVHGTGVDVNVDPSEYLFTPMLAETTDVITQEFQLARGTVTGLQVRLANEWTDLADCTLRFTITRNGETVWNTDIDSAEIENWQYLDLPLSGNLKSGGKYALHIQCVENRSGIPFKVFLCNDDLKESRALTFNGEPLEGELDLIYTCHFYPISSLISLIVLCLLGIAFTWLGIPKAKTKPAVVGFSGLAAASIFLFAAVEQLSNNSAFQVLPIAAILNIALILGLALLLTAVSSRTAVAGMITMVLFVILGIINHFTLLFRGTVLLPTDIYSASTAAQVLGNYALSLDKYLCTALACILLVCQILIKTDYKVKAKGRIVSGCCALAALALITVISINRPFAKRLGVAVDVKAQTSRSKEIGFLLNAAGNIKNAIVYKPANYSEEQARQVLAEHSTGEVSQTGTSDVQPNIIVIMAESFSELQNVADFETNTGYLDNFYRIAEESNSKAGKCVVSVFGGMTSCSEFEFLTGCSLQYLESAAAPYQQFIRSDITALPNYLRQTYGYSSYALHPCIPGNWNRDTAYPKMGFDTFISSENPEFADPEYVRWWVADSTLFDVMTEKCGSTEASAFQFAVSMQGHGSYTYENFQSTVELQGTSGDYSDVNQYLSVLKGTDEAFGELIEQLRASDEPTILLMFGDHLPSFQSDFYTAFAAPSDESAESQVRKFTTPYIIWANYDVDLSDVPDMISVNFLAPYLLKAAGIPLNDYYQYLYDLSQEYPVISMSGIIDADGAMHKYTIFDSCYEAVNQYQMVQYYFLFDSNE